MELNKKKLLEIQQVSAANRAAESFYEKTHQKSSEEHVKEDVLNFVVEDTNSATENLKAAYESLIMHEFEAAWISFSDCLKLTKKTRFPFVMDPFGGPVFDHLVQLKCRVIGPICILSCLKNSESLPVRQHPVYSVAMRKIKITCTNLSEYDCEEVFRKVELMGGWCTRNLTTGVTHLVVGGSVGSKKYRMAASLGLPIMTTSWIEALWNHDQYNPERHGSDIVYKVHQCPVFKGLSICISQLSCEERETIKKLVEQNGGNYSGILWQNKTTHLILVQPEGYKYNLAINWKIHCIKVDWLYDSVSAGYCKDEALYTLEDQAVPEIPPNSPSHQLNLDAEVSKISSVSVSCLDKTTRLDESVASHKSHKESYWPLEAFDVALLSHCTRFLYGCKVLVSGFNDSHARLLSKMIAQAGGTEFKKYSDGISHVIFGEKNAELIGNVKLGSSRPRVVSCQWLIECFNAQKMVDEAPYLYRVENKLASLNQDVSVLAEEKENNFSGNVPHQTVLENSQVPVSAVGTIMDAFDDYVQKNVVVPQPNDPNAVNQEQINSINFNESTASVVGKAANEHFSDAPTEYCAEEEECVSLKRMKFVIMGFGPKDTCTLTDMIVSKGGDIYDLNDKCEVDVAIVPIFWDEQPPKAKNVVTNCWLQKCIEDEKFLSYDENPLFKPLCAQPCIQPLEKCVISISQYTGTERVCLGHIAEVLGAVYQGCFMPKVTKNTVFKPSTHLIVPAPAGSRYEAAKKWNIPAVTKEWLIDAAKFGEHPPEEMYLVGGAVVQNQSSSVTVDCYHSGRNDNSLDIHGKLESEHDAEFKNAFKTPSSKVLRGNRLKEFMKADNNSTFLNPDFNVGDMLHFWDAPCNPGNNGRNSRKQSIPTKEEFGHHLALQKFSSAKTDSGHNRQEDSKNPGNSKKSGPLAGVVICVSESEELKPFKELLYKMVTDLDGDYCLEYDHRCTHFVCRCHNNYFSRELKTARDEKKLLVAPEWIVACKNAQKRVEEALYPPTYMSDSLISSRIFCSPDKGENSAVSRQRDEIISKMKSRITDQKMSVRAPDPQNSMCEKKSKNSCFPLNAEQHSGGMPKTVLCPSGHANNIKRLSQPQVTTTVCPDVPTDNRQCSSELPPVITVCPGACGQGDYYSAWSQERTTPPMAQIPVQIGNPVPQRRFMFSGFSESEKEQLSSIILKYGGQVSADNLFDNEATHLIMGKPLRTEILLSSVASGKWVLHESYIEAVEIYGTFDEEQGYEWGNALTPLYLRDLRNNSKMTAEVAYCPCRWRKRITDDNMNGAFCKWTVAVFCEKYKADAYRRILGAGGARVVVTSPPFPSLDGVTHAFIDLSCVYDMGIDIENLMMSGVMCLKPEYLALYLTEDPPPPEEDYLLPEARQYLDSAKTASTMSKRPQNLFDKSAKKPRFWL